MVRSSSPLALSVVSITEPGDVPETVRRMRAFDESSFGFNHDPTWNAMPEALRGVLDSSSVKASIRGRPGRIADCISALCALGEKSPRETRRFAHYPEAGLKPLTRLQWGPSVTIRVKGVCWYIDPATGSAVIPILQPRKSALTIERLSIYRSLAQEAFCQGDWVEASIEVLDLSGDARDVEVTVFKASDLPGLSPEVMDSYVTTYIEAKKYVETERSKRPSRPRDIPMGDFLDPQSNKE